MERAQRTHHPSTDALGPDPPVVVEAAQRPDEAVHIQRARGDCDDEAGFPRSRSRLRHGEDSESSVTAEGIRSYEHGHTVARCLKKKREEIRFPPRITGSSFRIARCVEQP